MLVVEVELSDGKDDQWPSSEECHLVIIWSVIAEGIHVISLKEVSGRFSFHFREINEKHKEYLRKSFMQIREI